MVVVMFRTPLNYIPA